MKVRVSSATIKGIVTAPASKSAMQRACAAALIRKGITRLHNPGISADDKAALGIIYQLGAEVREENDFIEIRSEGIRPRGDTIDCGESGLSVRLFTSLAALSDKPIRITGKGSLLRRPLAFFSTVLPRLGASCSSADGLLPLTIQGPMKPASIEIDGSLSSQFLTGLLFAYSAAGAKDVVIKVDHLTSRPYIDLTLQVLQDFGLPVPLNEEFNGFHFNDTNTSVINSETFDFTIEGDWSGAAFLLVAGAIAGEITVKGLDVFSAQADKAILQALMQSGAIMSIEEQAIHVSKGKLKAFHFNATNCPDLFPPLVALASCCEGSSVIEGVHRLEHKESNRALTLQEEFAKLGVSITLQDDLMIIKGGGTINSAGTHAHHDHRIAMACAVAALRSESSVEIDNAEAINKSYPRFYKDLEQLGVKVEETEAASDNSEKG